MQSKQLRQFGIERWNESHHAPEQYVENHQILGYGGIFWKSLCIIVFFCSFIYNLQNYKNHIIKELIKLKSPPSD